MKIRRGAGVVLVTVSLAGPLPLVWAQGTQETGPGIYTCVDAQGRKQTSDRPIADCRDREQQVINPSGTVRAVIGPTLTPQERARQELLAHQQQEERNRQLDEKRLNRVLLARYPTPAALAHERALELAPIEDAIGAAQQRLTELRADQAKVSADLATYANTPDKVPVSVRQQRDDNDQNMEFQQQILHEKEEERLRINQHFDGALVHLRQLWPINDSN